MIHCFGDFIQHIYHEELLLIVFWSVAFSDDGDDGDDVVES